MLNTDLHRQAPIMSILAIAILLLAVLPLFAQAPAAVPIPAQLTTAKTVFLGNAGDTDNQDCMRAYKEFYAGLLSDGHFQLVLTPASADLVLELHYEVRPGGITGPHSAVSTSFARQFRLVMIDPRTHTILWNLTEAENNAVFQSNRNKNLDAAVAQLLADFKELATGITAPTAPNKTRLSDNNK
jgi:hypothetical protein